jgi:hypothetical protein
MANDAQDFAISGLQEAADEIQQPLISEINWFQPDDTKNLDPFSIITGLLWGLA